MQSECKRFPFLSSLDERKLEDIHQAVGNVVAVRQDSHLQRPVGAAGKNAVAGAGLHLHDAGADVAEEGLLCVFNAEGVHETVARQLPNLQRDKRSITIQ